MPTAAARLCAQGHRFTGTRCPQCDRRYNQHRGSAASRGYGPGWEAFKAWFIAQLVAHDLEPSCGAVLPGGPQTQDSRCRVQQRKMFGRLHLDHEPPLQPHERTDPKAVQDQTRCQLLCQSCHGYKTWREQRQPQGVGVINLHGSTPEDREPGTREFSEKKAIFSDYGE